MLQINIIYYSIVASYQWVQLKQNICTRLKISDSVVSAFYSKYASGTLRCFSIKNEKKIISQVSNLERRLASAHMFKVCLKMRNNIIYIRESIIELLIINIFICTLTLQISIKFERAIFAFND